VSDTDSFIEEVTEEVRRDRLFAQMRKYGWIGVAAVALIVGGTAWTEWQKSNTRAAAQANGDALIQAMEHNDSADRIQSLTDATLQTEGASVVRSFLLAAQQLDEDAKDEAVATLNSVANTDDASVIYQQIANLKALGVAADGVSEEQRKFLLETLAQPGSAVALLASEQLALLDVQQGNTDAAMERLQAIQLDSEATTGLRRRVTQLIVALGGTPADLPEQNIGQ
jgi:hypothetical protein